MIRQFAISLVLAGIGSAAVVAQTIPPPPTDAHQHHDDGGDMATLFASREASGTS